MKNIKTSFISDPLIEQPFTGPSLDFLQEGNKEMINVLCRNIISTKGYSYSPSVPYYISGYDAPFTSDGAIFFNNELYILEENYATLDYAIIDTTPDSIADPLTFTDGFQRNVHNNRRIAYTNTAAGSLFAMSAVTNVALPPVVVVPPKPVYAYQTFSNSVSANALDPVHLSLKCSSELFDDDNLYNTSTGVFTVPKTGYYRVTGACRFRASATLSDGDYQFNIYINGTGYTSFTFEILTDGSDVNIQGDMIVKANIGDTIELYADGSFTAPSTAISYVSNIKILYEYLYQ